MQSRPAQWQQTSWSSSPASWLAALLFCPARTYLLEESIVTERQSLTCGISVIFENK